MNKSGLDILGFVEKAKVDIGFFSTLDERRLDTSNFCCFDFFKDK